MQNRTEEHIFHVNLIFCRFCTRWQSKKKPPPGGFFMPENRVSTVNALVVANTGLSACWLFRQELLVCHVNRKREKRHAKTAGYDRNRQSGV
ncbi:hypothetical protein FDV98_22820 [Escherichia coli]|nr:hypothetical protein [Escherichia coli]